MNKPILYGAGFLAVIVFLLVGSTWWSRALERDPQGTSVLLSQSGLHWHAKLIIRINGEEFPIPANLGLGVVHNPIHTHDDEPGLVHMEFGVLVRAEDLALGKFFKIWGKRFDSGGIFEYEAEQGKFTMTVDGVPSEEFENYSMRDGDVIEISYE